jgi:hypothetical protein
MMEGPLWLTRICGKGKKDTTVTVTPVEKGMRIAISGLRQASRKESNSR